MGSGICCSDDPSRFDMTHSSCCGEDPSNDVEGKQVHAVDDPLLDHNIENPSVFTSLGSQLPPHIPPNLKARHPSPSPKPNDPPSESNSEPDHPDHPNSQLFTLNPSKPIVPSPTLNPFCPQPADPQHHILDDPIKAKKCWKWITPSEPNDMKFTEFLQFVSPMLDKMWNKFDVHHRGIVESHYLAKFLCLPVSMYKSTAEMRKQRQQQKGKQRGYSPPPIPKLDQNAMKEDLEHLAVWITRNYGDQQTNGSYYFILTKQAFKHELLEYITEYLEEHKAQFFLEPHWWINHFIISGAFYSMESQRGGLLRYSRF